MKAISLNQLLGEISAGLDAVEAGYSGAVRLHGKRVAVLCAEAGRALGYDEDKIFTVAGCALLHDNALTEYFLSESPGGSQNLNRRIHCILGQKNAEYFPFEQPIDGYVLYHHECLDGSGPFGKKEGEFPEEAGLIALADQTDVRFQMGSGGGKKLGGIRDYLADSVEKYGGRLTEAALSVLTPELMERLDDGRVAEAFRQVIPEKKIVLDSDKLLRMSGIIAKIIDYKSSFTKEHTMQIANKALYMSQIYGYGEEDAARIYMAAALHDFGKLFIPTQILEKPGRLTDEEFEVIKSHAFYTWESLRRIEGFEDMALWASNHHEKLDGSGYPCGKKATELDFISRLIACLDIYQAVREARPYHPERSHAETMTILNDMASKGFVDQGIAGDLDKHLSALESGRAQFPDVIKELGA